MNFDKNKVLALCFQKGGTETTIRVRFPSDDLLVKRAKRLPQQMRSLHGGRTEAVNRDSDAEIEEDLALYKAIAADDDALLADEDLALKVVEILDSGQTRECRGKSGVFEIELEVLIGAFGDGEGFVTTHRLREPTVRKKRRYQSQSSTLQTLPGGNFRLVENLKAAEFLYDELFESCEGYDTAGVSSVPITHKSAVLGRLLSELDGIGVAEMAAGE